MKEKRQDKSDPLTGAKESMAERYGSGIGPAKDGLDPGWGAYDEGFGTIPEEHGKKLPPATSGNGYASPEEPFPPFGIATHRSEDSLGSQDGWPEGFFVQEKGTRETISRDRGSPLARWVGVFKAQSRTETEKPERLGGHLPIHEAYGQLPSEERQRNWVFWSCIAIPLFLVLAVLGILLLFPHPFQVVERQGNSDNLSESSEVQPVVFKAVSPRIKELSLNLITNYNTRALIYPKQLNIEPIETALKNEQDRRSTAGGPPFGSFEQVELIDRMLMEQFLVVTRLQVDEELKKIEDSMRKSGGSSYLTYDEREVYRGRIEMKLLETAIFGLEGLKTLPDVSGEAGRRYDRVRAGFTDEASFFHWAQKVYGSATALRRWTEVSVAAEKYCAQLESLAGKVAEDKIRADYEANFVLYNEVEKASGTQIFIWVPAGASENERKDKESLIRRIHDQLQAGADFEALAAQYSEDGNRGKGGKLNSIERDELDPELSAAVFTLRPNEISPVIRTPRGFHIVKLISRQTQQTLSYDKARAEILPWLQQQQARSLLAARLEKLKENLEITKP